MKKSLTKIMLLLAITGLGFVSCKKEGCTNNKADNYCSECQKDDGSCNFTGKMVIWWGKTLSDSTNFYGITALKVYVNGTYIYTEPTTTYWSGAPSCGANGSLSYTKNLGNSSTGTVNVELKDQNDNSIITQSATLTGNSCLQLEIPW